MAGPRDTHPIRQMGFAQRITAARFIRTVTTARLTKFGDLRHLVPIEGNLEAATYRQEVAREMSSIEIAKAQSAAREWLRTH